MTKELNINLDHLKYYQVADAVPLFPVNPYSENYPGDTEILGKFVFSFIFEKKRKKTKIFRINQKVRSIFVTHIESLVKSLL